MNFESYHRFNQSSPSLCGPFRSTSFQGPEYQTEGMFDGSTPSHQRSTSANIASPTENAEDIDTATRPRLTQEQVTELEREFSKIPKPNTEFKKNLADRIGLTLTRVNNWYQNRRAKSKNGLKMTEAQFEVRQTDPNNPWAGLDTPLDDFVSMSSYFEAANPQLLSPDEDGNRAAANYFFDDAACAQFNGKSSTVDIHDPLQYAFDSSDFACVPFSMESTAPSGPVPTTAQDISEVDYEFGNYSPENVAGIAMPEEMPADQPFRPMYQMAANGISMGNLSNMTFMSATSSSDGEPSLMTPPTRPSPPSQQQELPKRRDSITGGLTSGLHTFHLQSQRSSQALQDEAINTASRQVSPTGSNLQWVTSPPPHPSQESSTPSLASRIDLAARRKRPRPAPLVRPDATQRSYSYNAPLTSSPRSRSQLLDPSHPVRRVRSGLDVIHGRVQKSGSTPTQLSPRVFDTRFKPAFPHHRSPSRGASSTYQQTPLTPLSAAHNGECPTDFPSHQANDAPLQRAMTGTYDETIDFNSPPPTPHHYEQFASVHVQEQYQNRGWTMHEPPQSAPPQKTSFFFGDSPPMQNTNLDHLNWQQPAELHPHVLQSQNPVIVAPPQYTAAAGQLEQSRMPYAYQPQFHQAPQIQIPIHGPPPMVYQSSPEHLYAPHAQYPLHQYVPGPMGPFQHNIFDVQPVQQPLEIKVELGPSPQGTPQPPKQFTFSNSTPEDFASPKDEAQN